MKKIITITLILLSFLTMGNSGKAQNIDSVYALLSLPQQPSQKQVEEITLATKVWGFAKYHHPAFASKEVNADAHYFMLLNRILARKIVARIRCYIRG